MLCAKNGYARRKALKQVLALLDVEAALLQFS